MSLFASELSNALRLASLFESDESTRARLLNSTTLLGLSHLLNGADGAIVTQVRLLHLPDSDFERLLTSWLPF